MGTNSSAIFCNNCPRNSYGICSGIVNILNNTTEFKLQKPITVPAKQYLFQQGESPVKIFILRQGWLLLTRVSKQGKREIVRSVLPGDLMGFQTDPNIPFAYSAIAAERSLVCYVPDLFEMCKQYSDLSLKLIWEEEREKTLSENYMVNIAHRNAREKVAFMALELYQRLKLRGLNNGYSVPFPLNQEDIANTLGLTPVHVNRTLHQLQQDNLLSIHKHELSIIDYKKLTALVNMNLTHSANCEIPKIA